MSDNADAFEAARHAAFEIIFDADPRAIDTLWPRFVIDQFVDLLDGLPATTANALLDDVNQRLAQQRLRDRGLRQGREP